MSWLYVQSSGELYWLNERVATGYSGKGQYKNRPNLEHMKGLGPIPRGMYKIAAPRNSDRTGPYVLPLTPIGHNALGRTDFQIHGDSIRNPGTASSGCIIFSRKIREKVWSSNEHKIKVVAEFK